jgi:hypothetical protein
MMCNMHIHVGLCVFYYKQTFILTTFSGERNAVNIFGLLRFVRREKNNT